MANIVEDLCERISSYRKIKGVIVRVLQFIKGCRRTLTTSSISVSDFKEAESVIIRASQSATFPKDLLTGKGEDDVGAMFRKGRYKNLYKLSPFVDPDGIIRVGGRLNMMDDYEPPAIILKESFLSKRIVEHGHRQVKHAGRTTTIAWVRSAGFWIVSIARLVRSLIDKCVPCRRLRGSCSKQKMADLPLERLTASGPFVHCGMDMFGPFEISMCRRKLKRHIALFICLASRAIHLEVVHEMSTDSFMNALRRFLCRRGHVRSIRSDNGTNFVGAQNELQRQ